MNNFKKILSVFWGGMKKFGENIGIVVNTIVLSAVYFLGVGTTSIVARIVKKKFLENNPEGSKKTYWNNLPQTERHPSDYYRQF